MSTLRQLVRIVWLSVTMFAMMSQVKRDARQLQAALPRSSDEDTSHQAELRTKLEDVNSDLRMVQVRFWTAVYAIGPSSPTEVVRNAFDIVAIFVPKAVLEGELTHMFDSFMERKQLGQAPWKLYLTIVFGLFWVFVGTIRYAFSGVPKRLPR